MNMNNILEGFIAKYFKRRLMPGIREIYRRMQKKYGVASKTEALPGEDYFIASFGFQTAFMMKYMCMAFGAVCAALLVIGMAVNRGAFQGLQIFFTFFVLCLILWLISKLQSGYIVYTRDWIYVNRMLKKEDYDLRLLTGVEVSGNLTLVFGNDGVAGGGTVIDGNSVSGSDSVSGGDSASVGRTVIGGDSASGTVRKVAVGLEGVLYMDFMKFLETYYPAVIARIPKDKYEKARRKHGAAWGNRI